MSIERRKTYFSDRVTDSLLSPDKSPPSTSQLLCLFSNSPPFPTVSNSSFPFFPFLRALRDQIKMTRKTGKGIFFSRLKTMDKKAAKREEKEKAKVPLSALSCPHPKRGEEKRKSQGHQIGETSLSLSLDRCERERG